MKLEARRLGVDLKGRPVLAGVDFSAQPAEVTAVIGPNGAGKSTLLRTLAGLLLPTAGAVLADGRRLGDWERGALARSLAYLPQERTARAVDTRAIDAALAAMDVMHLATRPVLEMSGGERARVLVARALAQEPAVLLADEPAAGLDPAHQLALFAHFARLAAGGRTVVVALHDLSLAARFCHSIVLMHEGRVVAAGTPQDVLTVEHLAAVYRIDARVATLDGVPVVLPRALLP